VIFQKKALLLLPGTEVQTGPSTMRIPVPSGIISMMLSGSSSGAERTRSGRPSVNVTRAVSPTRTRIGGAFGHKNLGVSVTTGVWVLVGVNGSVGVVVIGLNGEVVLVM